MKKRKFWIVLRRNRLWVFLFLGLSIGAGTVLINQEMKLQELYYESKQLQEVADEKTQAAQKLREEVEAIDTDAAKEALARQKLNMIKRDEILYIVEPIEGND